ncbi:hypothetical protein [Nocardiopsis halotolerans]|uniref:hypothetical protein n=1 Tax=Nocardiopsis halotolerans TaxID=124252 RepID=UPI00059416B5|nr:hypothetical protein [Nocardiopsis halotolerans]
MTPHNTSHEAPNSRVKARTAFIFLLALLAGATIGVLRWIAGDHPAAALALALTTLGGAFFVFDKLIE